MKGIDHPVSESSSARTTRFALRLKIFAGLLAAVSILVLRPGLAEGQDDEYLNIYNTIQQADSLVENKQPDAALAKYREAQNALQSFQIRFSNWNKNIVSYRLSYVAQKISALTARPEPTPPPTTTPPSTTPPSTSAPRARAGVRSGAPAVTTTRVKLLDAGAEPRKALRLHPKAGDRQNIALTLKIGMDMKMGDQSQAMKLPAMTLTLDATVKNVSANGDITYDIVMGDMTMTDDPGTPPEMAAAMKSSLGSLKGVTGTRVVTSRGVNKSTEFKLPAGSEQGLGPAMDQLKESFSQAGILLPEEPVGPGARWEVSMPVTSQGLTIAQTAAYQLTAIDGDRLTAKETITQSAANQKIQNASTPGPQMELGKMSGTGTGETTFDLTQVLPAKATFDFHTELSMGAGTGDQKAGVTMKMDVKLEITGK